MGTEATKSLNDEVAPFLGNVFTVIERRINAVADLAVSNQKELQKAITTISEQASRISTLEAVVKNLGGTVVVPTPTPTPTPTPSVGTMGLVGVNMSGISFNPWVPNAVAETHYRVPKEKHIKKYADLGCTIIRLPFAAERIITGQGSALVQKTVDEIMSVMDLCQKYGIKVLIECHNYYRFWQAVPVGGSPRNPKNTTTTYNGQTFEWKVIGKDGCPINDAGLANMWLRIVNQFKDHPAIWGYGLMNEPHNRGDGYDVNSLWPVAAQLCIDTIRQQDRKNRIVINGNAYSTAKNWVTYSDSLKNLTDPVNLLVYDAHHYLDKGATGGGQWADRNEVFDSQAGILMVKPFVDWLIANGKTGIIGEHGYPEGNASAELATNVMTKYLIDNKVASFQWCAGPGWPNNDELGLDRDDGVYKTNLNGIKPYFGYKTDVYGPVAVS